MSINNFEKYSFFFCNAQIIVESNVPSFLSRVKSFYGNFPKNKMKGWKLGPIYHFTFSFYHYSTVPAYTLYNAYMDTTNESDNLNLLFDIMSGYIFMHIIEDFQSSFYFLHASAVSKEDAAIIFPALPQAGKTSILIGMLKRGFSYLGDDLAPVHHENAHVYPYPTALCVKESGVKLFDELENLCQSNNLINQNGRNTWLIPVQNIANCYISEDCQIRFIVFPKYFPECSTRIIPISRSDSCIRLMHLAHSFRLHREKSLDVVDKMVRHSECFELIHCDINVALDDISKIVGL